jgi:hypothetical protein
VASVVALWEWAELVVVALLGSYGSGGIRLCGESQQRAAGCLEDLGLVETGGVLRRNSLTLVEVR